MATKTLLQFQDTDQIGLNPPSNAGLGGPPELTIPVSSGKSIGSSGAALSGSSISIAPLAAVAPAAKPPGAGGGGGGGGSGGGGGGGGGGETTVGNNLSFPVILAGGITLSAAPIPNPTLTVPYTGPYTGLSAEQLAIAQGDTWYAQKVDGNKWQADFKTVGGDYGSSVVVPEYIDWGDNAESVNPKLNTPFRLEVTLYDDVSDALMNGYEMAVLAFPSSSREVQGTNGETYDSNWATVASTSPKLVVQHIEGATSLAWNDSLGYWTGVNVDAPETGFGFGPELNVGGKYVYGASQGGWKPDEIGKYRITFYLPSSSQIDFTEGTQVGDFADFSTVTTAADEGGVAQAIVDPTNNLTYIDVTVTAGGSGGKRPPRAAASDLISMGASEMGASNALLTGGNAPMFAVGQADLPQTKDRNQLRVDVF